MKFITTIPETSDEFKQLIRATYGIECTPMESSCDRMGSYRFRIMLGFTSNESKGEFVKHKGYTLQFAADDTKATNVDGECMFELLNFHVYPNEIWDKTIRTHEEVKNELDRLWEGSTYDERYALRRLYEFMREPYPC